jgi:hypothetical protein
MPNGNDSASIQNSGRTPPVDHLPAMPDPAGSRSDRLSSKDIDAQIRWFFENALERNADHEP